MAEMLAVSDAQRGKIWLLTLPELEPAFCAEFAGCPGRLAVGGELFCADRAAPLLQRFSRRTLEPLGSFPIAPETEALAAGGERLYALSGAANCLQAFDAKSCDLLRSAQVGVYPRALALMPKGRMLAVAGGTDCCLSLLDAEALVPRACWPVDGIACAAEFFAGCIYALCAEGEYDLRSIVGFIDARGRFQAQIALPGLPGALCACGGGLLVGHLGCLTMLDAPNCRIRWQTKMRGLPTQLVPLERFAAFADETDGYIGLIDLRRGKIYRRARLECPSGLAVV